MFAFIYSDKRLRDNNTYNEGSIGGGTMDVKKSI